MTWLDPPNPGLAHGTLDCYRALPEPVTADDRRRWECTDCGRVYRVNVADGGREQGAVGWERMPPSDAELLAALQAPEVRPSNIPPYTSHGHPTGATIPAGTPRPTSVARCGGPALCRVCARQAGRVTLSRADPVDGALDGVRRRTCPWPDRCTCDPAILDVPALPPDITDGDTP